MLRSRDVLVFLLISSHFKNPGIMMICPLAEEVWYLFLEYGIVFQLVGGGGWDHKTALKSACSCCRICCMFSELSCPDDAESKQINLVPCWFDCCALPCALSPSVCRWGSCFIYFLTVWLYFVYVCCSCISQRLFSGAAFRCLLDSFVSCCNSYAADNTKRLTAVTKLCCSWLSVGGEANQTFCWLDQEVGLCWNKWESCSSSGSHDSKQLRSQTLMWN